MREEQLFSKQGFYAFVVQSNVLLHKEAIEQGRRVLEHFLAGHKVGEPIRVLDLACGGEPISISAIMRHFPERRFEYTGIDINPDQTELAREHFQYPDNVSTVHIIEGNAWAPCSAGIAGRYDIIFMGMNLHHGTPEEVYYLATQIDKLLTDDGIFINHDWFRPDDEPYLRRPDHHPDDPQDSFLLLDKEQLSSLVIPNVTPDEQAGSETDAPWRTRYRDSLKQALLDRGGDPEGAASTAAHVQLRDYPISVQDFRRLFGAAGFRVKTRRYGDSKPFIANVAMPIVARSDELLATL